MPRIRLKPKSPEFADRHEHIIEKVCEMPGCSENAEHKAPKHRGLNEYYHFCFEHAREYNKAWNFFSGMSDTEVQDHVYKSFYGDRPTWKYASPEAEEALYNAAREHYFNGEEPKQSKQEKENQANQFLPTFVHNNYVEAFAYCQFCFYTNPPVNLLEGYQQENPRKTTNITTSLHARKPIRIFITFRHHVHNFIN